MSTTLEVILKTAGFTEGATAIKKVGDEATNTNNKLKTTTSTVDQVSKSTTSLGSKLANAGKQFSGTITNVAALGSTVVNLSRQYQDLSDTQIRVDKTQLKVSRTAEAVRGAQDKLNKLTKAGVTSGAAYEKALLDVQQAQDASTLAVTMNKEALEDQGRAYENFAMTLAPTILTAGSSITSMFKEMGGTKGMGGLIEKFKGLGGAMGGLKGAGTGMLGVLGPIGLAIAGVSAAFLYAKDVFEDTQKAMAEFKIAQNLPETTKSIEGMTNALDKLKLHPGIGSLKEIGDAIASMGPGGLKNNAVEWAKDMAIKQRLLNDELSKTPPIMNQASTSTDAWVNMMVRALQSTDPKKIQEFNKAFAESGQPVERYQEILKSATAAIEGAKTSLSTLPATLNTTGEGLGEVNTALVQLAPSMTVITKNTNDLNAAFASVGIAMEKAKPGDLFSFLEQSGGKFQEASTGADSLALAIANVGAKMISTKQAQIDSIAKATEHAQANLQLQNVFNTMGQTLTPLQALMAGMSSSEQNWVATTQASIAAENQHRINLVALIGAMGQHGASLDQSTTMLELEARAALGDAQAIRQLAEARKKDTAAAIANSRVIGLKIKGYEPGKVTSGPKYVTYRNGKIIGYGPGNAPPQRTPGTGYRVSQHGYSGTVKRPTLFIAGEGGRPEDVTVRPRGSVQRGGSGGGSGGSTHITISFEPQEFAQFIRYRINDNQGVVK